MGMTMTQKILAAHAGLVRVNAGQLIEAKLDLCMGNDITAPVAIEAFEALGVGGVFDRQKIALVPDHFTPNKDIASATQCQKMRQFAKDHHIEHYFEVGRMGIEHGLIPEKGLVVAGDVVIGADSHTCTFGAVGAFSTGVGSTDLGAAMATGKCWFKVPHAQQWILTGKPKPWVSGKDVMLHIIGRIGVEGARYQSMEFVGEGIAHLSMDDRFAMANMAIEAGAKNGIFPVDDRTIQYLEAQAQRLGTVYSADADAVYTAVHTLDLGEIPPTVAFPHLPDNTMSAQAASLKEIAIDQVVIGSCTNGRLEDLRVAAKLMAGKQVHSQVRAIVVPITQQVYLEAMAEGLLEVFIRAGAVVSTPTCGPCLGGHMGVLAKGERALSTTNRNFVGRMGHPESEVYLCSPAVAAVSAIAGKIVDPQDQWLASANQELGGAQYVCK